MMKLNELLDVELLDAMIADGYVRAQMHPELPLVIYNYTSSAQYEKVWNRVTRTCRGLIVDKDSGEVVARPFPKFFNHGEIEGSAVDLSGRVVVTDKADGSLGVLYPDSTGYAIATRGSFTSVQAIHATKIWKEQYQERFVPVNGITYLFEIVYPENRIVLDYGGMDDLIHLGRVYLESGLSCGPARRWPGPQVEIFPHESFAQALEAEPRSNSEGLVVHFLDSDERIKLKQEDYVALHRIVTGLSARTVWQHLAAGEPLLALTDNLPDEYYRWVHEVVDHLYTCIAELSNEIEESYKKVVASLPQNYSRKEFALAAKDLPMSWALFRKEDGQDYLPTLWKRIDPGAEWRPTTFDEDAA
jgi:RNA ligase